VKIISCCLLFAIALGDFRVGLGQDKSQLQQLTSSCSRDRALEIIQEQIAATSTFENDEQRITVLITAGNLLWPYREAKARSTLSTAFDQAVRNFKEKGDEPRQIGRGLLTSVPDQRYEVITAIAKHDRAWAKSLTEQILKDQKDDAAEKALKDGPNETRTAERLLTAATTLLPADEAAGLNFAGASLQYPATMYLTSFIYELAGQNRVAADSFYQQALLAYAGAPMERLLYLSAYPFGNDRDAGDTPGYMIYSV